MSIAFSARVTMHGAAWGDEAGSTVTFKLPMDHSVEDKRNPFHSFTKRRKGHAGTRFMMACQKLTGAVRTPVYEDEVMLAGWNDSQQNGHTVKFWICNDTMGHPFEGLSRQDDMVLVLSELDDDNETIDQKMRDRVEKQHATGKQRRSNVAALMCLNPNFWTWCQENDYTLAGTPVADAESAKLWMYLICNIDSRAHLDDPAQTKAIKAFESMRDDFAKTQGDPF